MTTENNSNEKGDMGNGGNSSENTSGIRVFVYGTLKQGHCNNYLLKGGKFLGRSYVTGPYQMVDVGWYPGVYHTNVLDKPCRIYGEVYRIDPEILASLDLLEGHPNYFKREKVATAYKNAWMYFIPVRATDRLEIIHDGVWKPSVEEREFITLAEGGISSTSTSAA